MIKAVVFDLYGTLIHLPDEREVYTEIISQLPKEKQSLARDLAVTQDLRFEKFAKAVGFPATEEQKEHLVTRVASAQLYPESLATVRYLKEKGYSLGLISNLGTPYKQPVFNLGLEKYFDHLVFSCDVGYKKPEKEIYQLMQEKLDCAPEQIIMVGDKVRNDVTAPSELGWLAVHLDRNRNSFSSAFSLKSLKELRELLQ